MEGDRSRVKQVTSFLFKEWNSFNAEVMAIFNDLHTEMRYVISINNTLLVLVSKKSLIQLLMDFRLISVINTVYKLISMPLLLRFRLVLEQVKSKF